MWRLATPLLRRMPHALPVAVVVSLVGGASTGDPFDVARALGLLPFFVVGLLATPERLRALRRPRARLAALAAFAVALGVAPLIEHHLGGSEWLYWRSSYAQLEVSFLAGVAGRLVLLAGAGVLAVSFFALLPRQGGWFTRLGSASMVVYLFHGFYVKSLEYTSFADWSSEHPMTALVVSLLAAVAVSLTLAAPSVASRLNVLVDPVGSWRRARHLPNAKKAGSPRGTGLLR